jgi:hypothetical protein
MDTKVRVAVRVRPFVGPNEENQKIIVRVIPENQINISSGDTFTFDHVFSPAAAQVG